MYVKLYNQEPNARDIYSVVEVLKKGGVVIYPTDTVYAVGCDINQVKAVQRVAAIKGLKPDKARFSMICKDVSMASEYVKIDNYVFKVMKANLPGPFTFILPATGKLPNVLINKRKTIGIRIPDNNIIVSLVEELGNPILTTSLRDSENEYTTEPDLVYEKFGHLVDVVIDGGQGSDEASTVIDYTNGELEVVRQGLGELSL